jgi:hypothetical protein
MAARRQNPKIERTLKRASSLRTVKQTFLIVCEGEVTEPEYFNSFRLTSANVKAIGKGMNTISLVKEAIAIRDIEKRRNRNYDQCWVVFDKDDLTDSDFNAAIQMAQANGFHVAYSNQAFEFWFLLHFNLYQGAIHGNRYAEMLTHLLGFKYGKAKGDSVKVFNVIYPRTRMAIDNAKNVLKAFDGSNPAKEESSTTVHQLVERLLLFTEN